MNVPLRPDLTSRSKVPNAPPPQPDLTSRSRVLNERFGIRPPLGRFRTMSPLSPGQYPDSLPLTDLLRDQGLLVYKAVATVLALLFPQKKAKFFC